MNDGKSWKASYAPTITVSDTGGSSVNNGSLKYSWKKGVNTTASYDNTFSSGTALTTFGSVNSTTVTSGNDWYLHVTASDALGNPSTKKFGPFWIDDEKPDATAPATSVSTNSITVTGKQSDSKSGISAGTWQFCLYRNSKWESWVNAASTNGNSVTFSGLVLNTTYKVKTRVKDVLR